MTNAARFVIFATAALQTMSSLAASPRANMPLDDSQCPNDSADLDVLVSSGAGQSANGHEACLIEAPVHLLSVMSKASPGRKIVFPDKPLLACAMARGIARFAAISVDQSAKTLVGSSLRFVMTGPGYECRPRNRQPGAKLSSHGQGLAVDVLKIGFQNGQEMSLAKPKDESEQRLSEAIQKMACAQFHTVLGPKADTFHADHIHIDLERRGKNGDSKFCQ